CTTSRCRSRRRGWWAGARVGGAAWWRGGSSPWPAHSGGMSRWGRCQRSRGCRTWHCGRSRRGGRRVGGREVRRGRARCVWGGEEVRVLGAVDLPAIVAELFGAHANVLAAALVRGWLSAVGIEVSDEVSTRVKTAVELAQTLVGPVLAPGLVAQVAAQVGGVT